MRPDNRYRSNQNTLIGAKGGDRKPVEVVSDKHEPVQAKPLEIKVPNDAMFEKSLRAFRSLVQKERILSTYKEKQSYEKPSDKIRRKKGESERKQLEFCSKGECSHTEHAENGRKRRSKERE